MRKIDKERLWNEFKVDMDPNTEILYDEITGKITYNFGTN